jgi:hypothetical protein
MPRVVSQVRCGAASMNATGEEAAIRLSVRVLPSIVSCVKLAMLSGVWHSWTVGGTASRKRSVRQDSREVCYHLKMDLGCGRVGPVNLPKPIPDHALWTLLPHPGDPIGGRSRKFSSYTQDLEVSRVLPKPFMGHCSQSCTKQSPQNLLVVIWKALPDVLI